MRRSVTVALVVIALPAAEASAHVLTLKGALRTALRQAGRDAERFPEETTYHVGPCFRRTSHTVDCPTVYKFTQAKITCSTIIRVQFKSPESRAVRVRYPGEPKCSGD